MTFSKLLLALFLSALFACHMPSRVTRTEFSALSQRTVVIEQENKDLRNRLRSVEATPTSDLSIDKRLFLLEDMVKFLVQQNNELALRLGYTPDAAGSYEMRLNSAGVVLMVMEERLTMTENQLKQIVELLEANASKLTNPKNKTAPKILMLPEQP